MEDNVFSQIDFGALQPYLDNDDITDISYSNNGQVWLKTLSKGIYREENSMIDNQFMEKLAFQCSNVMGKTFNMAHPFLDSESAELRMNFVHDSIAKNGIACVIRKTPAKIRLQKEKILKEDYITLDVHDFLVKCIEGHCNIMVCGETGSGKTEFVKYLASKTKENEKVITIEDTLELHLDRIFPHRDIVAMKTNNIASYTDVLVTCMRQNPIWILLSEVRSAEAVTAVRNSISSGHFILSTIHADKSESIPMRMYSLMETSQDVDQFMSTVYRYIQLGVCIRGRHDKATGKFKREIADITEFYVDEDNVPRSNLIYKKTFDGGITRNKPTRYLINYLECQGIFIPGLSSSDESAGAKDVSSICDVVELEKEMQVGSPKTEDIPTNSVPVQPSITNPAPTPQTLTQVVNREYSNPASRLQQVNNNVINQGNVSAANNTVSNNSANSNVGMNNNPVIVEI